MPDEKFDEKEMEKSEEKAPEEKWRRDPLGGIIFACILIWAGLVFLASNLGWLDAILTRTEDLTGIDAIDKAISAWSVVMLGAGVILLIEVAVRLLVPDYRRPVLGTFILGIVFIGIGLGDLVNWNILFPFIIIGIGLSILFRALRK
ncbi:MAG: hypothetical protein H6Q37_1555 [Chloroflexi bacterium]|nr:hypothetical protein [Chloroflexota bacterium]